MSEGRAPRRYEVMVRREGRWTIDCLVHNEVDAIARAEELYADESNGAVRVMRGHFSQAGESFETQLFERAREGRKGPPPIRLAAAGDDEAWCETLADFYGPSSRRAIARLLRNFLDRFQITPTELLHHHRFIKQLDNQESLLPSAIQRMAALQGDARGIDRRLRVDALDKFVTEATSRAREALASRAAPTLGAGGLAALVEGVAAIAKDPAEQAFWLRYGIARGFEDMNSFGAKFEAAIGWAASPCDPRFLPVTDEIVAGFMGAASMLKDVLGAQPHLGAALSSLADFAAGHETPPVPGAPPIFAAFAKLMAEAPMPETRTVLYDRLQRELASDKPLSRDEPREQRHQFDALLDKIAGESGIFGGGPAMVAALAKRSRKFDIVGGVEDVRFPAADAAAQIAHLFDLEKRMMAQRQLQSLATYLRDAIDRLDAEPAALEALKAKLAASALPDPAKNALLTRIPGRATAS